MINQAMLKITRSSRYMGGSLRVPRLSRFMRKKDRLSRMRFKIKNDGENRFKGASWRFEIERPEIFPEIHEDIRELATCVVESVEAMVRSARAFFKDITAVADHLHKVSHWETQSDRVSTRIQKQIFNRPDLQLSYRIQLRDFIMHVDKIADRAEDVADKLRIYVIKRSL